MKYIYFDCDECYHSSTPAQSGKSARHKAIEEGFVFMRWGCFCKECSKWRKYKTSSGNGRKDEK